MIQLFVGFAITIISVFSALLTVIWRSISARLRTLGHEDRDIRGQMHGIMLTLTGHLSDEAKDTLKSENDRLKWMIKQLGTKE